MQVGVGRPPTDLLQYLHLVMPNTRKTKRKQHAAPEENPALLIQSDNDQVIQSDNDGQRKMRNGDSSDSSDSDDSYEDRKRKCKKKHKKHGSSDSSDDDWKKSKSKKPSSFGKRVLSPEDVVHRYKAVLKVSMTNTCEELGVDRNTIAGTAVIADVMIATEGADFGELPLFKEKQTLANYAKLCKAFVDANKPLQEKIEKMRKATELLPIKYKMPK
ncbi:uncharacterized protein LOC126400967 isoform X4 [Epinephelus moara]|uniref:uncharacterized protein LOC126400967 isoform X4 n=1 Tax=Epinephelus moara TaxID=300413 RepID=UPI00214E60CC|nr:uncharacterized protein LOC126400967 isoform X4 [Epinephelus moara]